MVDLAAAIQSREWGTLELAFNPKARSLCTQCLGTDTTLCRHLGGWPAVRLLRINVVKSSYLE